MYNYHDLIGRSEDKGQKLREAWEAQQFLRAVEDVEVWIAEMETQLSSEDTGRDLISVNNLLKRHEVGCMGLISSFWGTKPKLK